MMAYDLHGAYETKTGPNAPLKGHPSETGADRYMNDVRLLFVYESRDNQSGGFFFSVDHVTGLRSRFIYGLRVHIT